MNPGNFSKLTQGLCTTVTSNISGSTIGVNAIGTSTRVIPLPVAQIKGEMFTVELNDSKLWNGGDGNGIKLQLVQDLLEKMMKSNCIEFTKQSNPNTMDYIYKARIFAVPNTEVQTIRMAMK